MDAPRMAPLPSDAVTTIATVLPALTAVLKARGIDPDAVFAEAQVARPAERGPLVRITVAELERIWAVAFRVTGDGALGIEVALRLRPASFHALGYSLQASRDLRDFGARLSRYFRFVSGAATFELVESTDDVVIEGRQRIARIPPESEDAFCGFIVRFIADLSEGECRPHAIRMLRPVPADGGAVHRSLLRCAVEFGADTFEIRFPRAAADVAFTTPSDELALHNDRVVIAYLEQLDRSDITARARRLIIEGLSAGRVSKSVVARHLNMSPRTLQHRLAVRNTTYHDLVEETRQTLARAYLEDASLTLTEIAFLLGFSNESNFSRAYRRWTGRAPGDFRRDGERGRN